MPEYILIGALGERKASAYSLSPCFDHAPWTRHLLEECSSELLTVEAGREDGGALDPGYSRVCAVAYRRPGVAE